MYAKISREKKQSAEIFLGILNDYGCLFVGSTAIKSNINCLRKIASVGLAMFMKYILASFVSLRPAIISIQILLLSYLIFVNLHM